MSLTEIPGQMMMTDVAEIVEKHDAAQYQAFTDKFKQKLTTDDCYTPENIMEAVQDWVAKRYNRDKSQFVRPFWPGADYQKEDYPEGCTVVDNPPFSLLNQICVWYAERGIPFFLFGPALTILTGRSCDLSYVIVGSSIVYQNGAEVPTSFVTNLDTCRLRTAPDLFDTLDNINDENRKAGKVHYQKYIYPDEIMTAAVAQRWCKYGIEYELKKEDCTRISALDSQRKVGKAIFGSGFLLGQRAALERAALERAAALRWQLSEREKKLSEQIDERAHGGDPL